MTGRKGSSGPKADGAYARPTQRLREAYATNGVQMLIFIPFPTSNTAYAARISTNIIQMPTQASAHHLNAYANTSQDIVIHSKTEASY